MTIGEKIRKERKALGLTQTELGELLNVKKNAVSKWECGRVEDIPASKIKSMANLFGVSASYLIDDEQEYLTYDNLFPVELKQFPMLGEIACGKPIYAEESKDTYVLAGSEIKADFCLRCKGDSMINARIYDGDIVFVRKQSMVETGEIAAVIIDEEVTLKRVYYYPDKNKIVLNAENPNYEPCVYSDEELNSVRILGKAVGVYSDLDGR